MKRGNKRKLPRAPLPKQTGGAHELKTKVKPKYRKSLYTEHPVACHRDSMLPCPEDEGCCLRADDWF